jgi:AraC family transcriptional regulator of arabinose operon
MDDIAEFKKEGFDQQKLYRLPMRAQLRMQSQPFTRDLLVTDIGYYPRATGHRVEREEGLDREILVFCLSGRGWYSSGGRRREVGSMDAFWIPAGEAHAYGSHRSEPWEIYWVHAYGKVLMELLTWTPLMRSRPMTSFSNTHAMRRQFNAVLQRLEEGYSDHTLFELSRFLVSLTSLLHVDAGLSREGEQRERIEKVMELMRKTLSKPQALAEYAKAAGFSVSQFSFLFKRYYGTSPMAYFSELRMQRAKEWLGTTGMPIKEIAWKLGFEDQLYFSRMFKKVTGISPSLFRTEYATGGEA